MKQHIRNGHLIDPRHGIDARLDLFLADGRVAGIGQVPDGFVAAQEIDATGCIVCPGLIDLSARLPGLDRELDAALAGGVTTLVCPPDSNPPLDEPGLVERLVRRSRDARKARMLPLGALTEGLEGRQLAELASLARAGCIAFSQAGRPVTDTQVILRAMQYAATFGYAIWLRPQDPHLSRDGVAHDGAVAARLGLAGIPACAETVAIATLLQLARETGVRLHLMRLSTAGGVALVRAAQADGLPVTCDVGIHHLHLTDEHIGYFDSNARFTPPLRSAADRAALGAAVADGVAVICSDHTPVDPDGKQLPFAEASPGASGLELLLPLTLAWARAHDIPPARALARLTCDPAGILGIGAGQLGIGARADVCIVDPDAEWTVTRETLSSQGKNSPFLGQTLRGRVRQVLVA